MILRIPAAVHRVIKLHGGSSGSFEDLDIGRRAYAASRMTGFADFPTLRELGSSARSGRPFS